MRESYSKYSDLELVLLLKKEQPVSEKAFTELYQRYASSVHAYCYRVLSDKDAAEDIFQDTFIKFYEKIDINNKNLNVPGFLITIARNLCLNYKRDKMQTVPIEDMDFMAMDRSYDRTELLELITRAIELLDFEFREAFVLREYDGLSYEEIANVTQTSLGNAKSRVSRAKSKVREILTPFLKDLAK